MTPAEVIILAVLAFWALYGLHAARSLDRDRARAAHPAGRGMPGETHGYDDQAEYQERA